MKINYANKDKYIIYINKYYYKYSKDTLEKLINKILLILENRYDFEIYSQINIKCYINKYYGIILEVENEYDAFLLYSKKTSIDIVRYYNSIFLFEVSDYFICNKLINIKVYKHSNKYYIELKSNEFNKIMELYDKVIYGDEVNLIIS